MKGYDVPVEQAPPPVHICVVYDPADGRVIHIHEFIGTTVDPDECAKMALDTLRSLLEPVKSLRLDDLKVLHAPRNFVLHPGAELSVDLSSNELVSSQPKNALADAIERSRAREHDRLSKSS